MTAQRGLVADHCYAIDRRPHGWNG